MIITITGKPGSGKTTVGKMLSEKLGYKFISMGDIRGRLAQEHGMTIEELNDVGMSEPWTDKEVDDLLKEILEKEDNLVIDSRMAWHFAKKSFNIFLDVDLRVAAERIFKDQRPDERKHSSVDELLCALEERVRNDSERYRKWYGVDVCDLRNYDLVIDTTGKSVSQVLEEVLVALSSNGIIENKA